MKKALLTILLILLIFTSVACNPNPTDGAKPKVYILSVGIGYQGMFSTAPGKEYDNRLDGTVEDATEFAVAYTNLLEERNIDYEIQYMIQREGKVKEGAWDNTDVWNNDDPTHKSANFPTIDNFKAKLTAIAEDVTEDDLFVLFYSGHGDGNEEDTAPSRDGKGLCFISVPETAGTNGGIDVLSYSDLLTALGGLECRKALIFDCCHSGNINTPEDEAAYWKNILGEHGLYESTAVLTAARYSEYSWSANDVSFDGEAHGWFTGNVLMYSFGWQHDTKETAATIAVDAKEVGGSDGGQSCIDEAITVHGVPAENYGISKLNLLGIYSALSEELAKKPFYNGNEGPYYQHMTLSGGPVSRWLAY